MENGDTAVVSSDDEVMAKMPCKDYGYARSTLYNFVHLFTDGMYVETTGKAAIASCKTRCQIT